MTFLGAFNSQGPGSSWKIGEIDSMEERKKRKYRSDIEKIFDLSKEKQKILAKFGHCSSFYSSILSQWMPVR